MYILYEVPLYIEWYSVAAIVTLASYVGDQHRSKGVGAPIILAAR